jgi:predicted membrane-bound spermidine synthase
VSTASPTARQRAALALLLALFFASGFAALLYQVIWQRLLAIFSGADVFSVTIVVAAFMGGLGCGNLAGGHLADRLSRAGCLALFAGAELAIALFALASKAFFYDFLYAELGGLALPMPALAALLFASVVWPTFFMGVSLPLLARGLTPSLEAAARTVGSLYGWNTLGAAAGAAVTTWLLLRRFDFETCLRIGAALNLACAATVLPLRRWLDLGETRAPHEPHAPPETQPSSLRAPVFGIPVWLLVYALSGAVALSLEIAWFRVLGVVVKSTSFTFGTLLAIYLAGVAAGSIAGSRGLARPTPRPAARFLALQACIPLYAALALSLLVWRVDHSSLLAALWVYLDGGDSLRIRDVTAELAARPLGVWTSVSPAAGSARLFLGLYVLLPLVLIGPPTFLMGLSFPYLQRAVQTDARFLGRRVGWLQTANIAGSLLGSLVTGFALLPGLGTPGTFRLLALLAGVFLLLWLHAARGGARPAAALALGAVAVVAAASVPRAQILWAKLHGTLPDRVHVAEDAAGLSLIRPPQQGSRGHLVMAGGLELSRIPYGLYGGTHTLLAALPILLHPHPRRVGVIGLGSGDTSFAAGGRPEVEEVETIEIVGSQLEVLRQFERKQSYAGLRILLSDPRFRIVVGDGRTHVRRSPRRYDVIEADALRPSSAYAGNLYSLEYFALLRASLEPGGLAVSWLPTERVRDTFVRSFPHVLLMREIGIGSEAPIAFDRESLLARCDDPHVKGWYARVGINLRRLLEAELRAQAPLVIGPDADRSVYIDVNSDLFAKDEFLHDAKSW